MGTTDDLAQAVIRRNASRGIAIPDRAWASYQTWNNLLCCHWPIDPAVLRPKVPAELEIDTYHGQAWVSLLPMRMGEIRLRELAIPGERQFPEINFRTYVTYGGRSGVYFFRIDCEAVIADLGAKMFFHTPYALAEVRLDETPDGGFSFRSHRVLTFSPHATFEAVYRPKGPATLCPPGSLVEFQAERYSAFARTITGQIVRGDLIHDPWLVQEVDAEVKENTILSTFGFDLPATPPSIHYAPGVPVVLWTFETVTPA
jgi:hypothetical protein